MKLNNALYLDGGVLLNLCATGRAAMIMQDLPYQCVTTQEVVAEEFVFGEVQQADQFHQMQHQFCSVSDLIAQGILEVRPFLLEQYYRDYVACSVRLPDTLARLLTLAKAEEASLATDDGCLQQMIKEFIPTMSIHSTPDLLQRWQDLRAFSDE